MPPPPDASPHFRVPLTDRFNYASLDCSARVHTAHRAAKSASSILSSQRDRYMLSPCAATPQLFVVVELCDDIRIDTVQLANFEFFSGVFREFTVSVAKTHAAADADAEGWTVVGTYVAKNVRGVQSFHPPTSVRDFYRYIRIDFRSHYSNEYYCPISLLRVYGLTHLEQWKWDTWEEESRARQDMSVQSAAANADVLSEPEQSALTPGQTQEDSTTRKESPSPATHSGDPNPDIQDQRPDLSPSPGSVEGHFRHSSNTRSETLTSPTIPADSDPPIIANPLSASLSPSDSVHATENSIQTSHIFSSNDSSISTPTASSSVFIPSRSANVSIIIGSTSRLPSQSTLTVISSPSVAHASALPPPPINHPLSPSPANVHAGESIYRTIMNRLSALETNTTLYARYVEDQTSAMREMIRRLSEDVGRLEGISRAQAQMYARSVNDFQKHRREMDIEQRTLISQVNYLADEIVLEKRLGIAQLCLLLAVLVFLSVTRGSPGEFHIPRSIGGVDSARSWGRRGMRLSADWVPYRLRSAGHGPPSTPPQAQRPQTPTALTPVPVAPRPRPAPPSAPGGTSFPKTPPGTAAHPATANRAVATTPTFRQKRAPVHHHHLFTPSQHHHRVSRSRSNLTHARTRSGGGVVGRGRGASPTSTTRTRPVPMQRSNSHGTPLAGPVSRSARRWARSAHLHEVRGARHQRLQHHHHQAADYDDVFAALPRRGHSRSRSRSRSRSCSPARSLRKSKVKDEVKSAPPAPLSFALDVADTDGRASGVAAARMRTGKTGRSEPG
ncbi:UNC-like C-terminal-domain-containing protein [Russula earlei]|uniref:UNC-like C-terminal-domain-containing protein n=1 Tax=Russula earlei TaxID=71964 RepID=A0ACC0TTR4_9AGAM|nr:UNC-like C-terminal-domain-containing protein [Russula earlei]